ncbi:MAG: signal peptidase II [Gemmatimonadaceae bacterium]|nr:signal peptidase II [Gemmatimonadaceae bacterium]
MRTRDRFFALLAGSIVVTDYVTKRIAESRLLLHEPVEFIGSWVRFTLTYNQGAAMNLSLGSSNRIVFSVLALAMLTVIVRMVRQLPDRRGWLVTALAMVAAGATGNLIDRLRSARGVVDFIDIGTPTWRFWTFNVADMGVTVGAVLLALLTWNEEPKPPAVNQPTSDPSASAT